MFDDSREAKNINSISRYIAVKTTTFRKEKWIEGAEEWIIYKETNKEIKNKIKPQNNGILFKNNSHTGVCMWLNNFSEWKIISFWREREGERECMRERETTETQKGRETIYHLPKVVSKDIFNEKRNWIQIEHI